MGKNVTDPLAEVAGRILVVRGQRVLLDADLAQLYGVSTKAFNQAVRRNRGRFPGDFLIELTNHEVARSRSQSVTLKSGRGGFSPVHFGGRSPDLEVRSFSRSATRFLRVEATGRSTRRHLSTYRTGGCQLDIAICDIKFEARNPWWKAQIAAGFHRARRHHGGDGTEQPEGGADERPRRADNAAYEIGMRDG
jgi:hypothetical protein